MGNLSSIGFEVHDYEAFQQLAEMVYQKGTSVRAGDGYYVLARDGSGAELWLQMTRKKEVIGMNPHFESPHRQVLRLETALSRKESPMDGAFRACLAADPSQQFVFDLPDAHTVSRVNLPFESEVSLVAFAESLEESKAGALGIHGGAEDDSAMATVCGRVASALFKINGWTGRAFLLLEIDLGQQAGKLEMVAPSRLWKGLPPEGTLIMADAWLSGRIGPHKTPRPFAGFIERLFWGNQ